ncbi:MAG: SLC45 family MFS transporter [Ignavibacteriae bacterium]|nr:SLC45 family MFS transporter [Ignavibacteriota bacterium]
MLVIQKKLTNTFYSILSLPATAMGFALSVQISALSWLLVTKFNLDLHEMGFVWAAGPIAGLIAQPIVGAISDNVWFWGGRRRPFILIGGTIAALMLLALPSIGVINEAMSFASLVAIAMVVALTLDLAINVSFNPTRSIIADVTPDGIPRTKGYTWMQTISGSFGVLAYAIGAIFGNYFLIYFGAVLVLAFTIIPTFFISENKDLTVATVGEKEVERDRDTNLPEFLKVCFANSFSWLGVQTMFVFTIAFISQKINPTPESSSQEMIDLINDKTGQIISISFLVLNAVGAVLPKFVLEPISEKIGRVKTQMISVAIMSIGYWGIVFFADTEMSLYIFMAVVGIGWAAIVSLPFAIMSETVDESRMGFFMGMFNLSIVIPQLIVSAIFGALIQDASDKSLVYIISGISLAVSSALWLIVKEQKDSKKE